MSIRTKLTLLFLAIIVAVALAISIEREIEARRLVILFENNRAREEASFDKIVALKNSRLDALVSDYSFWDEMVNFAKSKDKTWAAENIDTALPIFDVRSMWVYDKDFSYVYSPRVATGLPEELPLSGDAMASLFKGQRLCHFFISTASGAVEIRGASIHPTADRERKTEPQGYLFAGILWDEKYLKEISALTGTDVRPASILERQPRDTAANAMKGEYSFMRALNGWDGKPVMKITASFKSEAIRHYNRMGQTILNIFTLLSALSLLVLFISVVRWVSHPLNLVSISLKRKDASSVMPLKGKKDEFGEIARLVSEFFQQSAALKNVSQERRMAEIQEKAILDNITDMAWLKDRDSKFIAVNEPFAKACGSSIEDIIGKQDLDVWPREVAEKYIADDKEVMLSGKRKVVTEPLFSIDGQMSWIETIKTPIFNDKKEVIGTTGISRDVTDRKNAEEELKKAYVELKETQHRLIQAEKFSALGKFSSAFAHEIKNPLGIVLNGVEYLEMKLKDQGADVKEDLDIIKRSTLRADGIIKKLLKFARPSEVKLEKIKPNDLINDTLPFLKYSSPQGEIKINTELSKEPMVVNVDKNQMQQAIINMVLNAAEAMARGGEITIRAYKQEQSEFYFAQPACVIEISDNGPGITEENMSKLFEPFFTTKSEKGTGLGLFITKLIIDNNKGNISIDSRLGRGTAVKIILPLA
jgi:PAS domain S-box-containing protein